MLGVPEDDGVPGAELPGAEGPGDAVADFFFSCLDGFAPPAEVMLFSEIFGPLGAGLPSREGPGLLSRVGAGLPARDESTGLLPLTEPPSGELPRPEDA